MSAQNRLIEVNERTKQHIWHRVSPEATWKPSHTETTDHTPTTLEYPRNSYFIRRCVTKSLYPQSSVLKATPRPPTATSGVGDNVRGNPRPLREVKYGMSFAKPDTPVPSSYFAKKTPMLQFLGDTAQSAVMHDWKSWMAESTYRKASWSKSLPMKRRRRQKWTTW